MLRRIVASIDPQPGQPFMEIGAGGGEMTRPLVEAGADRVLAVETDNALFDRLEQAVAESGQTARIHAIHADFLALDLPSLLEEERLPAVRVVGNLPFSVASPILLKLLSHRRHWTDLTLMFQLEVAERLVARPGTKAYGFLTVVTQQAYRVSLLFPIPPSAFTPRPKVRAALVRLAPRAADECPVAGEEAFRALVRGLLAHRRKKISNNLSRLSSPLLNAAAIGRGLEKMGVDPGRRAETLSVEEFATLSHFCASPT
jgi:16S rRNA (adenine1518-N6/adenine1519-N6)-dimethyltransferase